jgi:hypothetical protein
MPSTTIHFPPDILTEIDRAARKIGVSRNKFVLKACEDVLSRFAGEWPKGFFETPSIEEDLLLLREAAEEMETGIYANRKNRGAIIL